MLLSFFVLFLYIEWYFTKFNCTCTGMCLNFMHLDFVSINWSSAWSWVSMICLIGKAISIKPVYILSCREQTLHSVEVFMFTLCLIVINWSWFRVQWSLIQELDLDDLCSSLPSQDVLWWDLAQVLCPHFLMAGVSVTKIFLITKWNQIYVLSPIWKTCRLMPLLFLI